MGAKNIAEKLMEVNEVQPAVALRKDRPSIYRKCFLLMNRIFEIIFALFFHREELVIHVEPGRAEKFRRPADPHSEPWRYPGTF